MKNIQDRNKIEKESKLFKVSYDAKKAEKAKNDANNANLEQNVENESDKSSNPYSASVSPVDNTGEKTLANSAGRTGEKTPANPAGKAGEKPPVNPSNKIEDKTVDKPSANLSGLKSPQELDKKFPNVNKPSNLVGAKKNIQNLPNQLSESGTRNRIASALGKKKILNKLNPLSNSKSAKENNVGETDLKEKIEEETPNKGFTSFAVSMKVIKIGMIAFAVFFPVIIFCVCLISASQTHLSAVGLRQADNVSNEEATKKINEQKDEDRNQEITDETAYDIYIGDEKSVILKNSKLNSSSVIQVANTKYDEALIEQLKDLYPAVNDLSKNYDEYMVYDFFLKMNKLYLNYMTEYNVELDLPLLMATLQMQSSDMNVIFSSNLGDLYRTDNVNDIPTNELDYYYDWSSYKLSKDSSEHDMEVLAQHMISLSSSNQCSNKAKDGKCYKYDEEKYKEFLKQFLEKKYFLEGDNYIEYESDNEVTSNQGSSSVQIATPSDNTSSSNNQNNNNEGLIPPFANEDYRNWTQCGQSWSSKIVPNSNNTMCQIGCLITSIAIQIARSATVIITDIINPGIAMENFNFAPGGDFYWNSTTNLAPNFQFYTKLNLTGMKRQSIAEKLASYDSSRYYIVLGVGKIEKNKLHHYVALDYVDTSTNKIYIIDPAGVDYTDLYASYKLYTAHIYEKKD